jgi:hypothetical protein
MEKTIIRLTESDLHRLIKESVKRILMEDMWDDIPEPPIKRPPGTTLADIIDQDNPEDLYYHGKITPEEYLASAKDEDQYNSILKDLKYERERDAKEAIGGHPQCEPKGSFEVNSMALPYTRYGLSLDSIEDETNRHRNIYGFNGYHDILDSD